MDTPDDHASQAALTYGSYLRVDDLLALQQCRSEGPEHDEMLFIVIHQVYELWFKELLHELDRVRRLLEQDDAYRAQHTLKRILTILKVMVAQLDILETMTPLEFLSFRDRLEAASGFQSDQFRQLEFVLGVKSPKAMERFLPGTPRAYRPRASLERADDLGCVSRVSSTAKGYAIPNSQMERDVTAPIEASPELQQILIEIYRNDPKNSEFCERLVDLDEGFQEWRYRHVKMVQRTIGVKPGTGGSPGAKYLETTLSKPAFPDLWEIRGVL